MAFLESCQGFVPIQCHLERVFRKLRVDRKRILTDDFTTTKERDMSKVMTDYMAKKAQIDALQEEAQKLFSKARAEVLEDVIAKIKEFGFNKRELRLPARAARVQPTSIPARTRRKAVAE